MSGTCFPDVGPSLSPQTFPSLPLISPFHQLSNRVRVPRLRIPVHFHEECQGKKTPTSLLQGHRAHVNSFLLPNGTYMVPLLFRSCTFPWGGQYLPHYLIWSLSWNIVNSYFACVLHWIVYRLYDFKGLWKHRIIGLDRILNHLVHPCPYAQLTILQPVVAAIWENCKQKEAEANLFFSLQLSFCI